MTERTEYGRIVDGKVVEYPVYELHIKNRAHPKEWYTEVVHLQKPVIDERHQQIRQELEITGKIIVAKYVAVPLSVDAILDKLFYPEGRFNRENPMEQVEPVELAIGGIDPELVSIITERVSQQVGQALDAFAKTRNYDDVKSAATYVNSAVPQFKAEAERVIALRDQSYASLYQFIQDVATGAKPVPKTYAEVQAILPELTWE